MIRGSESLKVYIGGSPIVVNPSMTECLASRGGGGGWSSVVQAPADRFPKIHIVFGGRGADVTL